MLKAINKLNTIYDGELKVENKIEEKIKLLWREFIKDKDPNQYYDGDIYCVTKIDENKNTINFLKTKYSYLVYAKKTKEIIIRSLFSAGYLITKDNYICIILNNKNFLNGIGGMADNKDIIDKKFDYKSCFIREFSEELGIDLNNNKNFELELKYLKYPTENELNNSFYPVGTLYEVKTNYTKKEIINIFNNTKHDIEIKKLKFYSQENYREIFKTENKTDYLEELFNILFK